MSDPWSITMAALALLGQAPNFVSNWEKLVSKVRKSKSMTDTEAVESERELLTARSDWLFHKIILLDLVIGFSLEHQMPSDIVAYCKSHRPQVLEELHQVKSKMADLGTPKGEAQ